jgi:hypothetical protein
MTIDYDHAKNCHTTEGAATAFSKLLAHLPTPPCSLIDVGCGTGVWLRAALENGVSDVAGIDGVALAADRLLVPGSLITCHDLTRPIECIRRYDVALCLEVGEHLSGALADTLIASLTGLTDTVVFSAACPGQRGQHHVNCQWPAYWQTLFNNHGFICSDSVRWLIWDEQKIEPWYRQNMFLAVRDPLAAGTEPRIAAVRHPDLPEDRSDAIANYLSHAEVGGLPIRWYVTVPVIGLARKLFRGIRRVVAAT